MGKLSKAKQAELGHEYIGKHGTKPRDHGKKVTAKRNARITQRQLPRPK